MWLLLVPELDKAEELHDLTDDLRDQLFALATQLGQMNEQAEAWKVEQETSRAEVAKCREMVRVRGNQQRTSSI